jgi:hypothetical protein
MFQRTSSGYLSRPQSNCRDVTAYLMLKLVQTFERSDLLDSCKFEAKSTTMNCELVGNQGEEDLFTGVASLRLLCSDQSWRKLLWEHAKRLLPGGRKSFSYTN